MIRKLNSKQIIQLLIAEFSVSGYIARYGPFHKKVPYAEHKKEDIWDKFIETHSLTWHYRFIVSNIVLSTESEFLRYEFIDTFRAI